MRRLAVGIAILGASLIVCGTLLVSVPAGLVVAGVLCCASLLVEVG